MSNRVAHVASALFLVAAIALAPAAFASKGGKPGGGGETSSSLTLVLLNSSDGLPPLRPAGDVQRLDDRDGPPVRPARLLPGGTQVYSYQAGFYPDYRWSQVFTLSSTAWTGETAECTANLVYTRDGTKLTTLATFNFHVYA
jgi:hypothetical protein